MKKLKIKNQITKSEAMAFKQRWEIVNAFEKKELCNTCMDEKIEQLNILMTSAKEVGWTKTMEAEVNKVRDRWNRLRRVYHV